MAKHIHPGSFLKALLALLVVLSFAELGYGGTYGPWTHTFKVKVKNKLIPVVFYGMFTTALERDGCAPDLGPDDKPLNGAIGPGRTKTLTSERGPSAAHGKANASVSTGAFAGNVFSGSISIDGLATTAPPCPPSLTSYAHAYSAVGIDVRAGKLLKKGGIDWGPSLHHDQLSGSAESLRDPIVITVTDLVTGTVVKDTILTIAMTKTSGIFDWDVGMLSNSSPDFQFSIIMDSPWTTQQGTLIIQGSGGLISAASKSGIFSSVSLPSMGSSTSFSTALSDDFSIDYDASSAVPADHPASVSVAASGSASTEEIQGPQGVPYCIVTVQPDAVSYPFHTQPGQPVTATLAITNDGNTPALVLSNISYLDGSGWLQAFQNNFLIPQRTDSIHIQATGPSPEGLYRANIHMIALAQGSRDVQMDTTFITIPVELYVFNNFFLPQDQALRTTSARLNVSQAGRVSHGSDDASFTWFADTANYLLDGSLIIGNSANNLSWLFYEGGSGVPSVSNPFGYLYATSNTSLDSTTFASYRYATGTGVNRDSSIGFTAKYYASKHPDSSNFFIAHYDIYDGPKAGAGSSNLTIAFVGDWDPPSDTGLALNRGGFDATRQLVWQQGLTVANASNGHYGGFAYVGDKVSNQNAVGGLILDNGRYVNPEMTLENDSIWNEMQLTNGWSKATDSLKDLSSVLIAARGITIGAADTFSFSVILAGSNDGSMPKSLGNLQQGVDKARAFICAHVTPGLPFCAPTTCACGDANGDGTINISDAVFLISYIFAAGAAPTPLCHGDANGDDTVNVSDAVFLIQYIFAGGAAPHCP